MRYERLLLLAPGLLLLACTETPSIYDFDGDGSPDSEDCAPEDGTTYPGAPDPWGDGRDTDCDACEAVDGDGVDRDCDGYPAAGEGTEEGNEDCNDNDDAVHPGADDPPGDELDADCDGLDGIIAVSLLLEPEEPTTLDDLAVSVETDIAVDGLSIGWFLDDVEQDELADATSVAAALTSRGDIWQVEVIPILQDKVLYGSRQRATAVIRNSAPTVDSVSIEPPSPSEAEPARAVPVGLLDADPEDVPFVRYTWLVNGVEVLGWAGDELSGSSFDRGDTISLEAVPTDGADDGPIVAAAAVIAVNTAPTALSVDIYPAAPTEDSVLTAALVGWEDPDPADAAQQALIQWFVNGVGVSVDAELSGAAFDKGDSVTVEATPWDGIDTGALLTSAAVTVANTPPSVVDVVVLPGAPTEADVLQATPVGALDPDPADTITWITEWLVNGSAVSTDSTLTGGDFARGDLVSVSVTPTDGAAQGAAVTSAAVLVANTPPSITGASIQPDPAFVDEPFLSAVGTGWSDLDGDAEDYEYAWAVNGTQVATGPFLPQGFFVKDDLVEVVVTPDDGLDLGAGLSATLTISNSPPSVTSVTVDPASGNETTTFSAVPAGFVDADGDAEGYLYQWLVNGQPGPTTATIDGASFNRADSLQLELTAWDGTDAGTTVSSLPITILDAPPTIDSVDLTPSVAYTDTVLTCAGVNVGDPDGDAVTIAFTWERDGAVLLAPDAPTLDGATWFGRDEVVRCQVSVSDGQAAPVSAWSAPVTIVNSAPTLVDASIMQTLAYTDTELSCLPSGFNDADGDSPTYNYEWFINGAQVSGAASSTLDPLNTVKTNVVGCEITPGDGLNDGPPISSSPVLIANKPPTAPVLAWDPGTPAIGQDLGCVVLVPSTDADGDSIVYDYVWYLQAVEQAALAGQSTVPAAQVLMGDRWACEVRGFDGEVEGPAAEKEIYLFGAGISFPPVITAADMAQATAWDATMPGAAPTYARAGTAAALLQAMPGQPGTYLALHQGRSRGVSFALAAGTCASDLAPSSVPSVNFGAMAVPAIADSDGDGLPDLLASSNGYSTSALDQSGALAVWLQPMGGYPPMDLAAPQADLLVTGTVWQGRLGVGLTTGDANADGFDDVLITGFGAGSWLLYGPLPTGQWEVDDIGVPVGIVSAQWDDRPAASGDFDGDGYDDFALANDINDGGIFVVPGGASGNQSPGGQASTSTVCTYGGAVFAGLAVGDFDGDGYDDLVCRLEQDNRRDFGVIFGGGTGLDSGSEVTLDLMAPTAGAPPWPEAPPQLSDLDGDGAADLLVPLQDVPGMPTNYGNFGLFLGGSRPTTDLVAADADVVFSGGAGASRFEACWIGPDLDGGGILDVYCSSQDGSTYIHLVEDTDNDGDLWSVMDCDADDNDPLVQ